MKPDPIEQLLHQADRAAGNAPTGPSNLAERVRQIARRRQQIRNVVGSLAACVAVAFMASWMVRNGQRAGVRPPPIVKRDNAASTQLASIYEAAQRIRLELAATATVIPDAAGSLSSDAKIGSTREIDDRLEQTACLIVYQGDRYQRELNKPDSAVDSYQQTIRLFPQTQAARTARARLLEIQNEKEKTS